MKSLLLTLAIVGLTYGASISKEEKLKVQSPLLTIKGSLPLGLSRILDGDSLDKGGPIIAPFYGYDEDLDWGCIWGKREALEKCSRNYKEMSDIEQSVCLLKVVIDCYGTGYGPGYNNNVE